MIKSENSIKLSTNEINFEDVQVFEEECYRLEILNVSKHSKKITVIPPISSKFKIIGNSLGNILAPGMGTFIDIVFFSEEKKDIQDELHLKTNAEQICIPINAYFPRSILSISSLVTVGPLKPNHSSEAVITINNSGNSKGEFSLVNDFPDTLYFDPENGIINPLSDTQILVQVQPHEKIGIFRYSMIAKFENQYSQYFDIIVKVFDSEIQEFL
eukprot:gb/GECH01007916.1/.p1 GENE.gb/GECH01007916.1/~~gb/GECH01007916.1/.p1  ORF type:complete len:214 (+),score=42.72 gb/GECH01007916.1/:1-642(+)